MKTSDDAEKREFKWLGCESVAPETESLTAENDFFMWALHRQKELEQMACEPDRATIDACECIRKSTCC